MTSTQSRQPRRSSGSRGRPRDPEIEHLVRRATLELLGEVGYDRTSIDAVAARSGVAKASVYRRWPGKSELVLDAIRESEPHQDEPPTDTGSLRGDLLALVPTLLVFSSFDSAQEPIITGLVQAMRSNPELTAHVRHRIVGALRHRSEIVVERAIARGEIAPSARALRLFHDIAPSMLSARMLLTYDPVDEAFQTELVDTVLLPLLSAEPGPGTTNTNERHERHERHDPTQE